MKFQLGSCQFVVKAENRRLQVIGGATKETMSLHGVLFSQEEDTDVDNSIDNLRAMANEQRPQLLVSVTGCNHGYWLIEGVEEDLLKEDFKIKLRWHGESP